MHEQTYIKAEEDVNKIHFHLLIHEYMKRLNEIYYVILKAAAAVYFLNQALTMDAGSGGGCG